MKLIAKQTNKYQGLLRKLFATDSDLVNKFHIKAGEGIKECANNTFETLRGLPNFMFYALYDFEKIIGYFGVELFNNDTYLTGFFLHPEYRTEEVKKWFWNTVDKKVKTNELFCGIYAKNVRAKKFLERSGFNLLNEIPTEKETILQFKKQ